MFKQLVLPCAMAVFVASAPSTFAATPDGSFSVRGIGGQTCADMRTQLAGENADVAVAELNGWVAGWLTHANRSTDDTFDVHPLRSITAISEIVSRLCAGNPEALVETVMTLSTTSIASGRVDGTSEIQSYTVGEASFTMRDETMQDLQSALVTRELLEEKQADGIFGPATVSAISAFQKLVELPETGIPDPLTLFLVFTDQ